MIFKLYCARSGLVLASSGECLHMFLSVITSFSFFFFVAFLFSSIKELHLCSWELLMVLIQ